MSCCSSLLLADRSVSCRARCCSGDVVGHRCALQPARTSPAEGPAERLPAHGELVARGRGVQVRPPAGCGRPQDRVRRPAGRARPSRRSPAPAHAWRLAHDIRHTSGPVRSPPRLNTTAQAAVPRTRRPSLAWRHGARSGWSDVVRGPVHRSRPRPGDVVPALPARLVLARAVPRELPRGRRGAGPRHPRRPPAVVRGRPRPAAAGLGRADRQLVGARRLDVRPAALPRGPGGAGGAGAVRGVAARRAAGSRSRPGWTSRRGRWPRSG